MADDFWFFVSYARIELNVHIKRFRQELAVLVRGLGGVPEPDDQKLGFLDINNLEHGRDWTADLTSGLEASRVLLPMYSPLYFKREYCGKEYQAFLNPGLAYQPGRPLPNTRSILPVLWFPISESDMPPDPAVRNLQIFDDRYPDLYRQKGLHFLMDTPGYETEYKTFLRALAEKIVLEAKDAPKLGESGARLKSVESILPAFPVPQDRPGSAANAQAEGPDSSEELRIVRFICTAAKRGEIQRMAQAYGVNGGIDWKPFAPSDLATGAFIAQEAALREKFLSEVKPLDHRLREYLKEAEDGHLIVIVLVDPWSLTNQNYRNLIAPCDKVSPTCAIIVAWNSQDVETTAQQDVLNTVLRQALPIVAVAIRHPVYFRDSADTRERLQTEIQSTLTELYMRLLQVRSAKLGLTAQSPPAVSNAQEVGIAV